MSGHRAETAWRAALLHRLSGLGLALFLPLHFLALGVALQGEAPLDALLVWTRQPLLKASEAVLVFLLALHLFGGLRLMLIEATTWRGGGRAAILWAGGLSLAFAAAFLVVALRA